MVWFASVQDDYFLDFREELESGVCIFPDELHNEPLLTLTADDFLVTGELRYLFYY